MLAAIDWRERRARDDGSSARREPAPHAVFRAAYQELCARIWNELELLARAVDGAPVEDCPTAELMMSAAILRLELLVLLDSCRSPRWRRLLSAEQRDHLGSMLTDVLATLYVDGDRLRTGIAEAQDIIIAEG